MYELCDAFGHFFHCPLNRTVCGSVEVFAAASALLDGGFMTAAGERRIIGALREAQDQLGEKVFLPAVTAVTQALEEAAQAPVSAPESDTEDYS